MDELIRKSSKMSEKKTIEEMHIRASTGILFKIGKINIKFNGPTCRISKQLCPVVETFEFDKRMVLTLTGILLAISLTSLALSIRLLQQLP